MEATELMVGDWVRVDYDCNEENFHVHKNLKVTGIDEDGAILTKGSMAYGDEDVAPIPITPEILEKNGWKEAQFWHEYQDGKNTIQSCLPDMRGIINRMEIQHFNCEYVHQYQHLLRLCGLNDLADNFKIE